MRILWVSAGFGPSIGGMQRYNEALCGQMAKRHEVVAVFPPSQRVAVAEVTPIPCAGLSGSPRAGQFREARRRLGALVDRLRPDLIHLGDAQVTAFLPRDVALPPVVATAHGNDFAAPWLQAGNADAGLLIRAGLNRCDHVVAVSRHTLALLRRLGVRAPASVVYNSCDVDCFAPVLVDRARFLARFGLPDLPLLFTCGRLARRKGHEVVLRALVSLERPFCWLVAGEGKTSRRLKLLRWARGMRRRMALVGWLSQEDLLTAYNASDLFVLVPTERRGPNGRVDSEGFGLVYHEAAACGVPSVASAVSGCAEAVVHEVTGVLVPPGDVTATRMAIDALLADPVRRRALGDNARRHVVEIGGWGRAAAALDEIYRTLVPRACRVARS